MVVFPNEVPGSKSGRKIEYVSQDELRAADAVRATAGFENARQCVHDDRVPLPPASRAPPPGDCTQSCPPTARSSYHQLPARSNWPPQGPSRDSGHLQKPHRDDLVRPGTAAAPAIRFADKA